MLPIRNPVRSYKRFSGLLSAFAFLVFFKDVINGSASHAIWEARRAAESIIEEFFDQECNSMGLLKREIVTTAVVLGIGTILTFIIGLAGVKFYSDINSAETKIKEANQRIDSLEKELSATNSSFRASFFLFSKTYSFTSDNS